MRAHPSKRITRRARMRMYTYTRVHVHACSHERVREHGHGHVHVHVHVGGAPAERPCVDDMHLRVEYPGGAHL